MWSSLFKENNNYKKGTYSYVWSENLYLYNIILYAYEYNYNYIIIVII